MTQIRSQFDKALQYVGAFQDHHVIAGIVESVSREADDVIALAMRPAAGSLFPEWEPGAHIDVVIGDGIERQYSLCGHPSERTRWRIGILREPASRGGSKALHEQIKIGDELKLRGPRNHFPLVGASEYILIAGGIGITPLLPMIHKFEAASKTWKLLYGGRSLGSMAFRTELQAFGNKVTFHPEDQFGLLDIAGWLAEPRPDCAIYCCGPERLIEAVEKLAVKWPEEALHVERFRPTQTTSLAPDKGFDVVLARSGMRVRVKPGQSIADALEAVDIYIPRSCNEGTCGTCVTKIVSGVPDHRDSFLRGKQREENKRIVVCCSRALTNEIVLDV